MYSDLLAASKFRGNLADLCRDVRQLPAGCGVYAIYHLPSQKIYIGSTADRRGFRARVKGHLNGLKAKRHKNPHLQNYFNAHPLQEFEWCILEFTTRQAAREREMVWLEKYQPWKHGFNVIRSAQECWTRTISEACKQKLSLRNSKPFALEFDGQVFQGVNLTAFAKARGLHQGALAQVLLGKMRQFKGWTLPGKSLPLRQLRNPHGEVVNVPHFKLFSWAKSQGLNPGGADRLLRDPAILHRGWSHVEGQFTLEERAASAKQTRQDAARRNGRKATAAVSLVCRVIKDNVIYTAESQVALGQKLHLHASGLSRLMSGKLEHCKGFRLA